ncbi:tetratricopeptide repeat protein [Kovacikia minuta CCNUW1]|uniref:serine/threonine-protein kinase n=1 Tax=Kovacikia minuta TaxID=2931930 RepID=UPI001CCBC302|nr:serine/threonine-protein kinase [Kovacikia minuta]UBF27790.1 tetratricopeptide repeat protein [Kovacikia minuta CCNUW1]
MSYQSQQDNPDSVVGKRYKLISQLGVGGFGQTFLAQDLHLPDRPRCVVKRLLGRASNTKHLQTARRLFNTEAKVLYQLGKHSQIPSLFAHFEENQEFYLVQEFVEGESLTRQIVKGKPWSEDRVVLLLRDILQILEFVHQQQVIHRDIKPSNLIRRRRDGKLVLIDFGAVKQVTIQSTATDTKSDLTIAIGTQGYVPNEQLAGKPRYCSDVYAVGLVGIQALTGVSATDLEDDDQTGEIDWRMHAPTVSSELATILDGMVCYDFRDRFQAAGEALEALQNLSTKIIEPEAQPLAEAITLLSPARLEATEPEQVTSEMERDGVRMFAPTDTQDETLTLDGSDLSIVPSEQFHDSQQLTTPALLGDLKEGLEKLVSRRVAILTGLAVAGVALLSVKWGTLQPISTFTPFSSAVSGLTGSKSLPLASPQPAVANQPGSLLDQANQLRQQRQYKQALALYDQVINLKPNMAQAYWGRCDSLVSLNQPSAAIVACNDALDLNPDYSEALWSKGKALKQQQRIIEALNLFEQATALKPNFFDAWVDRGMALQEVGRSVEAIEALDQAIALNRNSAEAWSTKGAALWNLGRFDAAVNSLDKALQIQPNAVNARALREQAKAQLGY